MLHEAGFVGVRPFFVEGAASPAGRGFERHLAAGGERGAQAGERRLRVAGPAADLAEVQVLDGEAAPGVLFARADDAELAVERAEDHAVGACAGEPERALAQLVGQVLPQAVHDGEEAFRGLAGVRAEHGKRAGQGDGLEKEARGDPGGDAHLPGLEDDVLRAALGFEEALHRVGFERMDPAGAIPDVEQLARHPDGGQVAALVALVCGEQPAQV